MKDYYAALGVSETATPEEIKKAYRRLAKQNHPDATGGDVKKGERFKEISEAYSVLSDETKRSQYDQVRKNPYTQNVDFGGDTGVDISEIFAQFFGGGRAGGFRNADGFSVHYETADGQGSSSSMHDIFGDLFGGGKRRARRGSPPVIVELDLKEAALGTIKSIPAGGRTVEVRIPPGADTGTRLRAGNLSLVVQVRPHPELHREGQDLHLDLQVGPDEAILGAKIEVPTIEGRATVTIPPGTSSHSTLRLRGKGIGSPRGGRGDLLVYIHIVVPKQISSRAKQLIEEFAREAKFRPRG